MKRERKGEVAAEIKDSFLYPYVLFTLRKKKKKKSNYTPPSVGKELKNQIKSPTGTNSNSVFCNIWAISGFLINSTDFPGTGQNIR